LSSWITMGPMEVVSYTFIGVFPLAEQLDGCDWADAAIGRARAAARVARARRREAFMASARFRKRVGKKVQETNASCTMRHCRPSRTQYWRLVPRLDRLLER